MENAEERILQYPDLSSVEQRRVEAYAADRPALAALLSEVKRLRRVLDDAGALGAKTESPDDEVLAYVLATLPPEGPPREEGLRGFVHVAALLEEAEEGSALHERCAALAKRLRALEAETRDPIEHFEAVTGSPLDAPAAAPAEGKRAPDVEPASPARAAPRESAGAGYFTAVWRRGRYAVAAAATLLVLYGVLYATSRFSQSQTDRLAQVEGNRLNVEGYGQNALRLRAGSPTDSTGLDQRYVRALRHLRAARRAPLGLFPHYDAEQLRQAADEFDGVAREAEANSFLQLEAFFFLGKARLAQGDQAGATAALRRVVAGGGRLASEAQQILSELHEEAAYDGPPQE